ncbi:amino acid ABC transporter ATP-binding protein [Dorea formicigenerans]|uniref:Amino acid ABC transporter ATP-binding protein n=1 Tax=Dorea formicigenerans TaxID=39486 RepID=A0A395XJH2_9FIRM|nr:amino acid ABC transporter ATP-binding protein [Dorea formicigenerans]RGR58646.1 amino acid ABC transporter ATP-binding protein [Dorea formicigenerans]RGT09082.1 amino acid ABC transporter ATP-binding protein [Dorea formicigenerans]RGW51079.1 amino acid ABC transporter ATP-binding protein [Dorea formicigenerans]RHE27187.1 amino acid ABC transporter ATP-binding protein [Dorea formicigenerans]
MIKVTDLHKSFGELAVLKGIDFQADTGEVIVIIGPSGMGKSTFLRCINYIERPEKGIIEIDNVKVDAEKCTEKEIKQLRLKTSMVFQNYNIFKNKTVIENVMLPMTSVQKIEKEIAKEKALQYLDQVGLLDKVNEYPSRLSGGQQQRVGIARAMAVNPKLILLDEPTSSLDPELVLGILDILRNLANEHKRTMIIVTHEMSFAKEIADRIIFMDDGRIIEEGTPEEIFSNPQNERTKRFLERFQTF